MGKLSHASATSNAPGMLRPKTRREVIQKILAGMGVVLAGPSIAQAHPVYRFLSDPENLRSASAQVAAPNWSPAFLSPHQNEVLTTLAEAVVPGSAKAQVNRTIDVLLTVESPENQRTFAASLAAIEAEATKRHNKDVPSLSAPELDQLLSACASQQPKNPAQHNDEFPDWKTNQNLPGPAPANLRDYFEHIKGWVVATYYSSEDGMRELGWTDEFYFEEPAACAHPEGH